MELDDTQRVILRIGVLIAGCTLLLTSSFVGLIALVGGEVTGFGGRLPWYLVGAALGFVATIVMLELHDADGKTIIVSAVFVGVLSLVLLFLGAEGFLYTVENPQTVLFDTRLVLYFFAAALVATGVGYWGLRHWREFTAERPRSI